jgi:hypothetical protein
MCCSTRHLTELNLMIGDDGAGPLTSIAKLPRDLPRRTLSLSRARRWRSGAAAEVAQEAGKLVPLLKPRGTSDNGGGARGGPSSPSTTWWPPRPRSEPCCSCSSSCSAEASPTYSPTVTATATTTNNVRKVMTTIIILCPVQLEMIQEQDIVKVLMHPASSSGLGEDTAIHRFVGSTVQNACHHGRLVDPTVNLKEAMDDINGMFGRPLNLKCYRAKRKANALSDRRKAAPASGCFSPY